jgi:glycosyltransferase involved in cell wall biosynthesis
MLAAAIQSPGKFMAIQTSVIVPTRNRSSVLASCLASLVEQSLAADAFEVIVVDNASEDATKEVVAQALASSPKHSIRYMYEKVPGLLSGRHKGAMAATGEILAFIDDDIQASQEWLASIVSSYTDEEVHLVGGRSLPAYETVPPEWIADYTSPTPYGGSHCTFLSLIDMGPRAIEIHPNYIFGLNFSVRKRSFIELGGFHPDCVPTSLQHFQGDGETGLTMKANSQRLRAVYQPEALVYHRIGHERMTPEYFESRCFYQGVCDSYSVIRRSIDDLAYGRWSSWLRRRHAAEYLRRASDPVAPAFLDVGRYSSRLSTAYIRGYRFHMECARGCKAIMDWILKEDYFVYQYPRLSDAESLWVRGLRAQPVD